MLLSPSCPLSATALEALSFPSTCLFLCLFVTGSRSTSARYHEGAEGELGLMQKTEKYDRQPSSSAVMPPQQVMQWPAPLFSTIFLQFGKLDSHPHRQVFGFLSTSASRCLFFSLPAGPQRLYAQKEKKKSEPPTLQKEAD